MQHQPLNAITTQQIQKYLEDNQKLIMAILEYQKVGRLQECAQFQAVLQKNLMYLAAVADAQQPTPEVQTPSQVTQMPQIPMPKASNVMQQPPQQLGAGGQKLPFQFNTIQTQDQQQQLLRFQQQQQHQQFQAQMGHTAAGAESGMSGMQSALGAVNPGSRQGGSDVGYGGDGRGVFFGNGSF